MISAQGSMTGMERLFLVLSLCLASLWGGSLWALNSQATPAIIKIGILAKRGDAYTLKRWQPTADYLTRHLNAYHFTIVPLGFEEIDSVVDRGKVDFVFCNSAIYVELEHRFGVGRIVTLRNLGLKNQAHDRFGGVVFAQASRKDLNRLEDLKGKRFAAVKDNSFGGYIMALREFQTLGINPDTDFSALDFVGTHDAVVYAVASGHYDAGTVRTDTLERMASEGLINLSDFRILSPQKDDNFGLALSTRLYPEWPLAKLKHTDNTIASQVASVLLAMPETAPAAIQGNYNGWAVPGNYQHVHDALRELRIGPYQILGQIRISDLIQQYGYWILAITALGLLLIASNLYILQLNRSLRQSQQALQVSKSNLEQNYNELRVLQEELIAREKMASLGRMVAGFAHEVNTPIGIAVGTSSQAHEAAEELEKLLKKEEVQEEELHLHIATIGEATELALANLRRASELVQSFKRTSIDQTSEKARHYLFKELVDDVIASLHTQFKRTQIVFNITCPTDLKISGIPGIHAQLLTNLIMNSRQHGFDNGKLAGEISIEVRQINQNQLLIDYKDNGSGMTADTMSRLYEPFFTTNHTLGGSGLGMYICYNLVTNQLKGNIHCECQPGHGVHFHIAHPVDLA